MYPDLWDQPIEVTVDGDHFKSVSNSRDALAYLMTDWPPHRGAHFVAARKTCIDAIEGRARPGAASEAFRAAAKEAGILR